MNDQGSDRRRSDPESGFVLGYVLGGEIRFGVDGGEQTICRANQVFCEPAGVLHPVSANAVP